MLEAGVTEKRGERKGGRDLAGRGPGDTGPGRGDRWCLGGGGPEGLHLRGRGGAGKGTRRCLGQPLSPAGHPSPELQQVGGSRPGPSSRLVAIVCASGIE